MNKHEIYMRHAFGQAARAFSEDEVPVGAVIVYEDRVIAKAYNQVELLKDPTAHAEMIAITSAAAYLKSKWLEKCTLYVTIEPCSMCAGALVLSRMDTVVFGACDPKTGAFGSKFDINALKLNHDLKVVKGVLQQECGQLIQEFFQHKRKSK